MQLSLIFNPFVFISLLVVLMVYIGNARASMVKDLESLSAEDKASDKGQAYRTALYQIAIPDILLVASALLLLFPLLTHLDLGDAAAVSAMPKGVMTWSVYLFGAAAILLACFHAIEALISVLRAWAEGIWLPF